MFFEPLPQSVIVTRTCVRAKLPLNVPIPDTGTVTTLGVPLPGVAHEPVAPSTLKGKVVEALKVWALVDADKNNKSSNKQLHREKKSLFDMVFFLRLTNNFERVKNTTLASKARLFT